MTSGGFDPVSLAVFLALLGMVPLLLVVTSSFLKISVVLMLVRNALGVQQVPPNILVYALSLILSMYVMAPVLNQVANEVEASPKAMQSTAAIFDLGRRASEPMRGFLLKHTDPTRKAFFMESIHKMWPPQEAASVRSDHFLILMPAFVVSQLASAFEVGFLLYLPFIVIDLVVSNILLALGMMMVSPSSISVPLKLFLFVSLDGWTRLLQGLVLSYV
ncbi:type III secretion system export apparatus subunit SctR [Variovorax saccharolyticus]|uniref:type III secretion system export apparatus subunit SctR n=1 Tax=Variovorax saccharolyticus TaxID=3053516 RepID=UPI002576C52C|nr:type III secretion system export apparatus subunit SctR [Variovorax sp. J31P216]MDM0030167.1 type III secretion system export apparatus subunit SctR [Variovorax sp. J31P216]